ncbi:putative soyasapogenol B glucuronide galactosyltransferase [Heracleum sosnowskyi]|uniref:Glycosyltransferase n=1 Tax=Heracleum sosnowskyi TaxID=360622 RepID=A0AAD8N406_9APIA|nr:putative soyasapogenol B glucuronide galactosyltransferase [Heracleum sosnowskyi]
MASLENYNIHVVFLPYFTSSHLIPLIDAALLFASRDSVKVSIITTPHNVAIFQSSLDKSINSGHQIAIHSVKFPSEQVHLPEGIESFSTVTSSEQSLKVWQAIELIQKPMENLIRSLSPDCIFSDMFYPWTVDLALELNIPRLMFFASSFFSQCIKHNLKLYAPYNNMVESGTENFSIPEFPDNIKMKKSQLLDHYFCKTQLGEYFRVIEGSQTRSYGTVHDTFFELEPAYVNLYKKTICKKSWHIGPLFQFSGRNEVQISGKVISSYPHCLNWLNAQKPNSVVYVCFDSMVKFSDRQFTEILQALNASNQPYIFVTKKNVPILGDFDENKGMIINGWAPQIKILNHVAVGGFMTHCGWNSVLEAMVAGVPLITWPLFAEQFFNERLIIQILGNGVEVGSNVWNLTAEIKSPVIDKQKIKKAVVRLMGGSGESEMIRRRAEEISVMAKRAVEEGGTSYNDLNALIQDIKDLTPNKND